MKRHLNLSNSLTAPSQTELASEAVALVACACRVVAQVVLILVAASRTGGVAFLALHRAHPVPLMTSDASDAPSLPSDSTRAIVAAEFHLPSCDVSLDLSTSCLASRRTASTPSLVREKAGSVPFLVLAARTLFVAPDSVVPCAHFPRGLSFPNR